MKETSKVRTSCFERLTLRIAIAVLFAAAAASPPCGTAGEDLAGFLPGNSQLALLLDDAADAAQRFQSVPLGKMLAAPAWQPYFSAVRETHTPSLLHLRPWFGIDWGDLADCSVPAALVVFPDVNSRVAVALVIDARGDAAVRESLVPRAEKYFQSRGARIATESVANGRRTTFDLADGNAEKQSPVSLEHQGRLAFVNSTSGAQALLQFWSESKAPSLQQVDEYSKSIRVATDALGGTHAIRGWIRPLPLARSVARPEKRPRGSHRDLAASAERLGMGAVQAVGGVVLITPSGSPNLEAAFSIQAPPPYAKALQMATLRPGAWRAPPAYLADATASWWMLYQDVPRWFDGFGFLFDEIADPESPGTFRDVLDAAKKDPEGPKIDIEREIVARLDSGVFQASDYRGAKTEQNPDGFRAIVQLSAQDETPLRDVFQRNFKEDELVQASEVNGQPMWNTAPGQALMFDTGDQSRIAITSLALIKGAILLSTDAEWLREVLSGSHAEQPLAKSRSFVAAESYLHSQAAAQDSLRSFSRLDESWRVPYRQLTEAQDDAKSEPRVRLLELLLCPTAGNSRLRVLAALPPWTSVAPSLGVSAASMRPTADGFAGVLGVLSTDQIATVTDRK